MKMADCAVQALRGSLLSVTDYTPALAEQVRPTRRSRITMRTFWEPIW